MSHALATASAGFAASLVEFVEALTIVLAVGTVRGWRPALLGAATAVACLAAAVALFGPLLLRVPIGWLQGIVGLLLLLFGLRWLRKAVLRAAGVIALHDELAAFRSERELLDKAPAGRTIAFLASYKAVLLEGLEVVFIVLALGAASGRLLPATLGAGLALALVLLLGALLHRPLARVPENALKLGVGVLLSGFGVFWLGEGGGLAWPGGDLAIPMLLAGFLLAAWAAVAAARRGREAAP